MILVSSCLTGKNCRYDGSNNYHDGVMKFLEGKAFIDVCPEELGGLSTPRKPAEIGRFGVCAIDGERLGGQFLLGARKTLELATQNKCTRAIMKAKSPSCGFRGVYDGTFSKTIVYDDGITTKLLRANGIRCQTEQDFE